MPRSTADHRPDFRLAAALTAVVLAAVVGPAIWVASVRDRLPDEVAAHWGTSGVTRTEPVTRQFVVLGVVTLLTTLAIGIPAVVSRQPIAVRRALAGATAWTATLLGTVQIGALRGQLDLADGMQAPMPDRALALGTVLGVVIGVAVAACAYEQPHTVTAGAPPPASAPRLAAAAGPPPSLHTKAASSRAMYVMVGLTLVPLVALAPFAGWWMLVLAGVLLAGSVMLGRYTVRIDQDGLTVRAVGWTALKVPIAEITDVEVIAVDPFWDFGGWGIRIDVHGRTGIVTRRGPAVQVHRADGTRAVVSIDDADHAAKVLVSLADAHHAGTLPVDEH